MPGAGGIRAANFLAQQAPRDGTAITTFAGGPILEPLIGSRHPGYDMSQFTFIGAVNKDIGLCIASAHSPFKVIDDARREQMIVAGTGAGSDTDTWPVVLNAVLGTRFKLVTGYVGTQETLLAIERGEVHGRCVISVSALKTAKPDWLRDHKINVLALTALERSADFPGVPTVVELVGRAEDRSLLELMAGPTAMARPFVGPPGMPANTATLLRRAFDATMADPEFRADAAKIQADIAPSTGEAVQALVARLYATPRPVIERLKKLLAPS
jgi:tripartite-type tricarboxylate transporter receptor subunit TctC